MNNSKLDLIKAIMIPEIIRSDDIDPILQELVLSTNKTPARLCKTIYEPIQSPSGEEFDHCAIGVIYEGYYCDVKLLEYLFDLPIYDYCDYTDVYIYDKEQQKWIKEESKQD